MCDDNGVDSMQSIVNAINVNRRALSAELSDENSAIDHIT